MGSPRKGTVGDTRLGKPGARRHTVATSVYGGAERVNLGDQPRRAR
jgi:hypothetical protein